MIVKAKLAKTIVIACEVNKMWKQEFINLNNCTTWQIIYKDRNVEIQDILMVDKRHLNIEWLGNYSSTSKTRSDEYSDFFTTLSTRHLHV